MADWGGELRFQLHLAIVWCPQTHCCQSPVRVACRPQRKTEYIKTAALIKNEAVGRGFWWHGSVLLCLVCDSWRFHAVSPCMCPVCVLLSLLLIWNKFVFPATKVFCSLELCLSNALLNPFFPNYSLEMQQNVTFVNLKASKAPAGKRLPSFPFFKEVQSRSHRLFVNLSLLIMFGRLSVAE